MVNQKRSRVALAFTMVSHVVGHGVRGVDFVVGGDEHFEEVGAGEAQVIPFRQFFLLARHSGEEEQEVLLVEPCRVDTFVAQLPQETGIAIVRFDFDDA